MLTEANVKHFLENVLEFENWAAVLEDSKQHFLFEIVSRFGTHLYYENITWGAMEASERKLPKIPDIISHVMETHGGACVHLNYFLKLLLDFFEFNVEIFPSEVPANGHLNSHLVLVVRFDSVDEFAASVKEDMFLVDVGMGRPITAPINLNKLPHRSKAGGFDCEVRFNQQSRLHERVLYGGCAIKGKLETDHIVEVLYDLQHPKQLTDFDDVLAIIFTDSTDSFFCNTIFLFKFVSITTVTEFEFVNFRGRTLVRGSHDERNERKFENYAEMADDILSWFPSINESVLRKALSNYDLKRISKAAATP